ncbi:LysR family transcriptional regulator [Kitasatospora sp. MMS16-BH015]|uniref:LysR family transcriptional regulator n=1 Tax=Kitasatospora sp. MMS16-BH015 TaxID=2018025 RepID=UPI000CA10C8E|nr:LysR family transcriptional regulator [Kitasatospora sp. MMS16-BH015]AUG82059.1 LysR family transcriptional regulator [Kitasatospora sp. MMS16-BH015]
MGTTARNTDLNLLHALDVLLDECSVTAAADRLELSAPAMSRTLARIRTAFCDPILVRSGRAMVPTPRALAVHAEVKALLDRSRALFAEGGAVDTARLTQTFTVVASDLLSLTLATRLLPRLRESAPGVTVVLLSEGRHQDDRVLREGRADLEVRVIADPAPETRVELLLVDEMVIVVRSGHPLTAGPLTPAALAGALHVTTSRRGRLRGPLDDALAAVGLHRRVVTALPTFGSALHLVADSDLVGLAPAHTGLPLITTLGLAALPSPLPLPPIEISMGWHPRHDSDPAQLWFREQVRTALRDHT